MKRLVCSSISSLDCKTIISAATLEELKLEFITHFNQVHDPDFVAKCQDDLEIEYQNFISKINNSVTS